MNEIDEEPPLFARWSSWYWLVMMLLLIEAIIFLVVSLRFA